MVELTPSPAVCIRSFNRIPQSKSMYIMPRGHIETDPATYSYFVTLSLEYLKGPCLIGILVRSLIGLFALRSNLVSKVYQHRSRNGGILEVARSTGSLRKNSKRHDCWGVNTRSIYRNLLIEQARIEHAPIGSLLTYINIADAMVKYILFLDFFQGLRSVARATNQ